MTFPEVENMPSFKCKDIGMECPFEVRTKSEDEIMKIISTHAAGQHNLKEVSPDMMKKIKTAIKP